MAEPAEIWAKRMGRDAHTGIPAFRAALGFLADLAQTRATSEARSKAGKRGGKASAKTRASSQANLIRALSGERSEVLDG